MRILSLLSIVIECQICFAHFNLYLKNEEVRRILGLPAELFYVREGVVNDYALGWTVPVPANVHTLYFSWEALLKKPVLYNMAITSKSTNVPKSQVPLYEPSLNIPLEGHIPNTPSTFQLELPCTGFVDAEVDVILNINVTSPRPAVPPTVIYFRRRKICLKGESTEAFEPHQDPKEELEEDLPFLEYLISAVVGTVFVLVLIVSVALCKRKMTKDPKGNLKSLEVGSVSIISTKERLHNTSSSNLDSLTPNNMYTLPSSITVNSYASLHKTPMAYFTPTMSAYSCNHSPVNTYTYAHPMGEASDEAPSMDDSNLNMEVDSLEDSPLRDRREVLVDPTSVDFRERFKMLQIERQRIRITSIVREGKFGRIYRGWIQGDKKRLDQQIIIKTIKEGSPPDEEKMLCREGTRLFNVLHNHILSLHGVSFADQSPSYLIYADHGSTILKTYLLNRRDAPLKTKELIQLALQAARGLACLHSANVLHADIAARNAIVDDHLHLRLTDSSLSPDIFPSDYVAMGGEAPRPLKWMAQEVISDKLVSTASDVWSFGVFLWELGTLGQQPYMEVQSKDMADYLRDGYRLAQPLHCPDDLYKLMAFCWAIQPFERPRAETILSFIQDFQSRLNCFI